MHADGYRSLADFVLVMHVGFVAFVIVGLLSIFVGGVCGWGWIRNPWFRAFHLAAIGLVVAQAWLEVICPLTTLEMYLRGKAGDSTYSGSFIGHWLQKLLYYEAPQWVFALCYSLFGLAVIATWVKFRPRPFRHNAHTAQSGSRD